MSDNPLKNFKVGTREGTVLLVTCVSFMEEGSLVVFRTEEGVIAAFPVANIDYILQQR